MGTLENARSNCGSAVLLDYPNAVLIADRLENGQYVSIWGFDRTMLEVTAPCIFQYGTPVYIHEYHHT